MKKITRFSIFESKIYEQESSDGFVNSFTQNASIALEQLFALLKVTPPASKGEDKTEANNAFDRDLRNKRILAYKELSGSADLKSLMNLLITKANTVYSEIARNDAQRKAAVEKNSAEAAEKYVGLNLETIFQEFDGVFLFKIVVVVVCLGTKTNLLDDNF